jgi:hypothetical protein
MIVLFFWFSNDQEEIKILNVRKKIDHNSNYGEKSKNWKEAIKTMKEFLLKDLKLVAPLNEQSVSKHLEELLEMYKKRQGESRGASGVEEAPENDHDKYCRVILEKRDVFLFHKEKKEKEKKAIERKEKQWALIRDAALFGMNNELESDDLMIIDDEGKQAADDQQPSTARNKKRKVTSVENEIQELVGIFREEASIKGDIEGRRLQFEQDRWAEEAQERKMRLDFELKKFEMEMRDKQEERDLQRMRLQLELKKLERLEGERRD